jgi:hypothetical protein
MSYPPSTIAKAIVATLTTTIGAATVAAHGVDVSTLSLGDWLSALGAGFVAGGGVFVTPNKDSLTPAEKAAKAVQEALDDKTAAEAAVVEAEKNLQKVTQAVSAALPSEADKLSYDIKVNSADDVRKAAEALSLGDQVRAINAMYAGR